MLKGLSRAEECSQECITFKEFQCKASWTVQLVKEAGLESRPEAGWAPELRLKARDRCT